MVLRQRGTMTRLNKYIAECGVCSRREAERRIFEGRVTCNGQVVFEPGKKIDASKDRIAIDGQALLRTSQRIYFALNKPTGYMCSNADPHAVLFARDLIDVSSHLYCVGRLDVDSEGLVIYTNDGEFAYKMTHPSFEISKQYLVVANRRMEFGDMQKMAKGLLLEDGWTRPCSIAPTVSNEPEYAITIHEGRKRQIRRMFASLGYSIQSLKRISHGNIFLGHLPCGQYREFTDRELRYVEEVKKDC